MAITKKQSDALAKQVFEYAPAPEAIDHVKIQPRYGLFIGGRMVEGHSKKHFPTINPATEKKLAEVVEADEVDVDRTVRDVVRRDPHAGGAAARRGQHHHGRGQDGIASRLAPGRE